MTKPTDIQIKQVATSQQRIDYRTPIKFGGRVVTDALLFNVEVEVETRDGRSGRGFGSMPMGNAWGWPSAQVAGEQTLAAMTELAERYAVAAGKCNEIADPLEITHALSVSLDDLSAEVTRGAGLAEAMPRLAQLVAASPVEAAIHDAFGKVHGQSAYNVLGADFANRDLSAYLNDEFKGEFLDRYTLREPKPSMPLYHLVGALDPLVDADIAQRIDDGLPETLGEWILADGLTHLKIKLAGDDLDWDVKRVAAIEAAAAAAQAKRGATEWHYSLDFNEKCANVEYVLDFLARPRRSVATGVGPRAVYRATDSPRPAGQPRKSHARGGQDQAGGHR